MRFLGVDLAWTADNPSGVVALEGVRFPLRLVEGPRTLRPQAAVLDWLAEWLDRAGTQVATAVGIDAPLLGLDGARGRRDCDDVISSAFGRFGAPVHSFSRFRPMLSSFAGQLEARCPDADLSPECPARPGRTAVREVYPNALQVRLFDLDRPPLRSKLTYKQRGRRKTEWAERGLAPFVGACTAAIEQRGYVEPDEVWRRFVSDTPSAGHSTCALKALEDRWDAVLCALAVALEHLEHGVMHAYTGPEPGSWRQGYILAPVVRLPGRRTSSWLTPGGGRLSIEEKTVRPRGSRMPLTRLPGQLPGAPAGHGDDRRGRSCLFGGPRAGARCGG